MELLSNLNMHEFDQNFLEESFIAFACDGASSMIEKIQVLKHALK